MKVTIQYHGMLRKYNQDMPEREEELPEGATVGDLIARSGVPGEEIAFAAVDDSRVPAAHALKEGDRVKLFQLVGGG